MNVNFKSSRRIASAFLLSLVLAGCASGPSAPSPELLQRIESARTRGDHEALAAHYDQQAVAARAIARDHRRMAKAYQGRASDAPGGGACRPTATPSFAARRASPRNLRAWRRGTMNWRSVPSPEQGISLVS